MHADMRFSSAGFPSAVTCVCVSRGVWSRRKRVRPLEAWGGDGECEPTYLDRGKPLRRDILYRVDALQESHDVGIALPLALVVIHAARCVCRESG